MVYSQYKGFSLIELIVVLIIVSLSSVLLAQGLTTTWRNFAKLNVNQLSAEQTKLPLRWFANSVNAALLSHPERKVFGGDAKYNAFTSYLPPDQSGSLKKPSKIRWSIMYQGGEWRLIYNNETYAKSLSVFTFKQEAFFSYLVDGQWLEEANLPAGKMPRAIAIVSNSNILVTAVLGRPTNADIPAEYPVFGSYEFGT